MRRASTLLITLALVGCVRPARVSAPEPPRAARIVAPPPPSAVDWRDRAATPGLWIYRRDARGSLALFGAIGANALLTLRCDLGTRAVYLSRSGSIAAPLAIRTSTTARMLSVQPTGGTPAYVATMLAPADALLDAIAFSRGRFMVEQAGESALIVPAWPEIGRVVEDCRG